MSQAAGTEDLLEGFDKLSLTHGVLDKGDIESLHLARIVVSWGPIVHLAHYSCDPDNNISYDLSCLQSFREPKVPADLRRGVDQFCYKNRHNCQVGHPVTLEYLTGACAAFHQQDKLRTADVVTWRGILVKLMLGHALDLRFSFVDGTLYLIEYDNAPGITHVRQLREGYQGYAFEALCTDPKSLPDLSLWKCIVSRTLGDLNIVFGGEVDCVRGQYDGTSDNFVELKTVSVRGRQNRLKWYLQSFLLGVPEIYVGQWDGNHTLKRVESLPLETVYVEKARDIPLQERFANAYRALKELRMFCTAQEAADTIEGNVWKVTIRDGSIHQPPYLLERLDPPQW